MLRQYHAQRRQGGDNPLGVGTIALGSIFYLQDDGYWRARFGRAAVCRTPWIVESFLNGQYHAARRDPATGHWLSVYAANRTDLAVMVRPPPQDDMQHDAFAPHPYVIVAAPDHPLAGQAHIGMAALLRHPFVVRERGSDTWHSMEDAFGAHLAELQVAMEIRSTETIKQAVIAGMGLGFLSAHTIGRELLDRSLTVLQVDGFPLMLHWYVVHRREKRLPPVARAFHQFLLDEGAQRIAALIPAPWQGQGLSG